VGGQATVASVRLIPALGVTLCVVGDESDAFVLDCPESKTDGEKAPSRR